MKKIALCFVILTMAFLGCKKEKEPELEPVMLGSAHHDDHDYRHITFINQTGSEKEFCIDISFQEDLRIKIDAHSANYITIPTVYRGQTFTIYFRNDGEEILKDGKRFEVNRKETENLYLWWEDGEYKVNDEPHVMADKGSDEYDDSKPAILFAHGYNDNQLAWDLYAQIAKEEGWRVFRTSVPEDGSIKKRASILNAFIKKAADQCCINRSSLRVVGHSMGGLDIRYIISNKWTSSQFIERVYTIATPHSGSGYAYLASLSSDAARDLQPSHMADFNANFPYKEFKRYNTDTIIDFLALRFACAENPNQGDSDFIVEVSSQNYPEAPCSKAIYPGKHMPSATCVHGYGAELEQADIIRLILNDKIKLENEVLFEIDRITLND